MKARLFRAFSKSSRRREQASSIHNKNKKTNQKKKTVGTRSERASLRGSPTRRGRVDPQTSDAVHQVPRRNAHAARRVGHLAVQFPCGTEVSHECDSSVQVLSQHPNVHGMEYECCNNYPDFQIVQYYYSSTRNHNGIIIKSIFKSIEDLIA